MPSGLPSSEAEQQRILSKFVSMVAPLQDCNVAKAKLGPPPLKPGWVQVKLSKQGSSRATGTGVTSEPSSGSSSSSSGGPGLPVRAQPGKGKLSGRAQVE